tara:strand:+ start:1680 stop:3857 length:2178 start_codon:yes stop_codon:yes gene_type:complete
MKDRLRKNLDALRMAQDANYTQRKTMQQDMEFAFVDGAQWFGSDGENWGEKPKMVNNTTMHGITRLVGQYSRMEMGVRFSPLGGGSTDEDAEALTGAHRYDIVRSDGKEADSNAALEAFTCGLGATLWTYKYRDEENPDPKEMYMCKEPVYSASSCAFWSVDSIRKDKSDCKKSWVIEKRNREDLEQEYGENISSVPIGTFATDDMRYRYDDEGKDVYIAHTWEVVEHSYMCYKLEKDYEIILDKRVYTINGNEIPEDQALEEIDFYQAVPVRKKKKVIECALISGDRILEKFHETPFKRQPLNPRYGYYIPVAGLTEIFGEVRFAKDPQRFGNFLFSSLAQLASENQTQVPEYLREQTEDALVQDDLMSKDSENPAYLNTDVAEKNGQIFAGPVHVHGPTPLSTSMQAALQYAETSKSQQEGTGQSTVPSNASADAIKEVNQRADDRYQMMFDNQLGALTSEAYTWKDAFCNLHKKPGLDIPIKQPNGDLNTIKAFDRSTSYDGMQHKVKYTFQGQYEVDVKMDEAYKDKLDRQRDQAMELMQSVGTDTQAGQLASLIAIQSTEGENTKTAREIARYQELSIIATAVFDGVPMDSFSFNSEQEQHYVMQKIQQAQQAAQNPQPDPMMLAAQAEMEKAAADKAKVQADQQADQAKREVDIYQFNVESQLKQRQQQLDYMKLLKDAEDKQLLTSIKLKEVNIKEINSDVDNAVKIMDAQTRQSATQ